MTSDSREGAYGGQGKRRIDPAEVYSTEELTEILNISDKTLDGWAELGLKRVDRKKLGMKTQIYFGDCLLEFLRNNLV